ncbi:hypothetical protein MHL31_12960 [Lutibacter sp. A80]|uniref:hypothetical protein n=1 Tax=Lutibacter sp. A80 TaxID=2918453 RepID=UPI001F063171|nr:hypothetical protein [Lutibacter sp. A80]UMB59980.1 hypothetical protein MHL31_12960 [Lutibacter sp. A80]
MTNTIEKIFSILHGQNQKVIDIVNSKKIRYALAPLLPVLSMILSIQNISNNHFVFFNILILIESIRFTFLITTTSFYFLSDISIFEKLRLANSSKESKVNFFQNEESLTLPSLKFFRSKNRIKRNREKRINNIEVISLPQSAYPSRLMLFLNENNKESKSIKDFKNVIIEEKILTEKKVPEIVFTDKQLKLIEQAFFGLKRSIISKKPIISDDNTLEDFITAMKFSELKESQQIMLELKSKHCVVFLRNFFIPFVKMLTKNELNLKQASKRIKFKIGNRYKPVKLGSIYRKDRQLSTEDQRSTYKRIIDETEKSLVTNI